MEQFCRYYRAHVKRDQAWFFVAIVRSYEHMMFDRTLDIQASIFEFFVPHEMEPQFLALMDYLTQLSVIQDLKLSDNRLTDPTQMV